jgi:SPP1 family predicted phage head-tail adaptor
VTLQSPPTATSGGELSGEYTDVAQVSADIRCLSGLEAIKSSADVSVVKASIRIRHRGDVLPSWRVVFGSRTYDVKAVLPDGAKRWLDLACEVAE